jgi:tRNA threonylcarbamoyladenosine biosynthesis protein TsaB
MTLLALEFSAPIRSLALLERPNDNAPWHLLAAQSDPAGRKIGPLALVEALLAQANATADSVSAIVLGLGPGSYTGIRSAIALAQGWHLAHSIPIYAVGTADCLAVQAQQLGCFGSVTIGIDAQRNECYLANYELTSTERRPVRPLRLGSLDELRAAALAPGLLVGPEVTKWTENGRILMPQAATLAQLIDTAVASVPANRLEPIYLRETTFVKAPPPRKVW